MVKGKVKNPGIFQKYFGVLNYRTAISVAISLSATWICYHYHMIFNLDLTLISVGVVFPLVFTLGSAFQRREKALEHMGRAKGALAAIKYCFSYAEKVNQNDKTAIDEEVKNVKTQLIKFLYAKSNNKTELNAAISRIQIFITTHGKDLGKSLSLRVYRLMRDVIMGVENAISIKSHRTPHSIRAYCELFIYVFPFFYAPTLIKNIQFPNMSTAEIEILKDATFWSSKYTWIVFVLNVVISFFLITLFNIQEQIENPFDQDGQDDIILENFLLDY